MAILFILNRSRACIGLTLGYVEPKLASSKVLIYSTLLPKLSVISWTLQQQGIWKQTVLKIAGVKENTWHHGLRLLRFVKETHAMRVEARSHSVFFELDKVALAICHKHVLAEISNTSCQSPFFLRCVACSRIRWNCRGFRTAAMDWTDMGWKQDQIRIQGKEILLFVRLSNPVHFFLNLELISLRDQNSSMQSSLLFFAAVLDSM